MPPTPPPPPHQQSIPPLSPIPPTRETPPKRTNLQAAIGNNKSRNPPNKSRHLPATRAKAREKENSSNTCGNCPPERLKEAATSRAEVCGPYFLFYPPIIGFESIT